MREAFKMNQKRNMLLDTSIPFDYAQLMEHLYFLESRYPFLELSYLGTSVLDRAIPQIKLGCGRRKLLYVGTHHAMEWITSALLSRFLGEFCHTVERDGYVGHLHCKSIFNTHTIYIIPMLNPDGTEYQIHGIREENPLYERLLEINGGSHDFSRWQANARGVDLNHNYDAGFEKYTEPEAPGAPSPTRYSGSAPESEPEVRLLCNFIRYHEDLLGVMTLHTQGREIFFGKEGMRPKKSEQIAARLSRMTGYALNPPVGSASFGGLSDWCTEKMNLPSFTLECGKGNNPLPFTSLSHIYAEIREALFTFPILL
ncbi:MAG: peptidase M14 [Ruminococcaceae bacterium]|nr:peptidase M14 [Oscillospiraceae bacterium]